MVIHTGEETERQRATRLPYLTSGEPRVSLSCALVCFLTHCRRPTELYKHMSTPAHGEHMPDTFPPLAQSEPSKTRASVLCFALRARRKSFTKCPKRDSRLNNGNSSKDALSHAVLERFYGVLFSATKIVFLNLLGSYLTVICHLYW